MYAATGNGLPGLWISGTYARNNRFILTKAKNLTSMPAGLSLVSWQLWFRNRSSSMRTFALILFILSLFLSAGPVFGQYPTFQQLPKTQEETGQLIKNVEDQSIPQNQPGLVYEEIRVARQKTEQFNDQSGRVLPEEIHQLDASKITFQQTLESLENLAKNCGEKENPEQIRQSLQEIAGPFGLAFSDDGSALNHEIRKLLGTPPIEACKTLGNKQEIATLQSDFNSDSDKTRQLYTLQIALAGQLEKAWSTRLAKLEKLQSEQLQTFDLQKMVPYLVGIVCLFAVVMFLGVRMYDTSLQMELISSGQIIQFPTVMILLVIIAALAISKTISENTVSALLGGIAGYVLSQGIGRAAANAAQKQVALAGSIMGNPAPVPAPQPLVSAPATAASSKNV